MTACQLSILGTSPNCECGAPARGTIAGMHVCAEHLQRAVSETLEDVAAHLRRARRYTTRATGPVGMAADRATWKSMELVDQCIRLLEVRE